MRERERERESYIYIYIYMEERERERERNDELTCEQVDDPYITNPLLVKQRAISVYSASTINLK